MNKTLGIGIVIIIALAVGIGIYSSNSNKNEVSEKEKIEDDTEIADMKEGMMGAGSYEEFATEKLAQAEEENVVLFFHASWCPSCRGLDADIKENMSSIPEDLSILKVDYDTQTDLKKKYGVTHQHTLVQVDDEGNIIKKWSGSPTLDRMVLEIQ